MFWDKVAGVYDIFVRIPCALAVITIEKEVEYS